MERARERREARDEEVRVLERNQVRLHLSQIRVEDAVEADEIYGPCRSSCI
mgnify:CR=1 FL=1